MKHTPAPWILEETISPLFWRVLHKKHSLTIKHSLAIVKNQANAQLIAAAPDMLQALQLLLDTGEDNSQIHYARSKASAAINKAIGEAA